LKKPLSVLCVTAVFFFRLYCFSGCPASPEAGLLLNHKVNKEHKEISHNEAMIFISHGGAKAQFQRLDETRFEDLEIIEKPLSVLCVTAVIFFGCPSSSVVLLFRLSCFS
jgi:hypothetical protein